MFSRGCNFQQKNSSKRNPFQSILSKANSKIRVNLLNPSYPCSIIKVFSRSSSFQQKLAESNPLQSILSEANSTIGGNPLNPSRPCSIKENFQSQSPFSAFSKKSKNHPDHSGHFVFLDSIIIAKQSLQEVRDCTSIINTTSLQDDVTLHE